MLLVFSGLLLLWFSFQSLSFQVCRQCTAIHGYECDREMVKDSENDGLFCMLGSKPENELCQNATLLIIY